MKLSKLFTTRRLAVAAVVLVVAAGAGAALATTSGAFDPREEQDAFQAALAKQLGVSQEKLEQAYKAAAIERIDAAVAAGRLTREQGNRLKQRVEAGAFLGPMGFLAGPRMFHGPGLVGGLDAAADYLGLTEAQLREKLRAGQSLADVAKAQGKPVDGLKKAMLDDAKARLDQAVKDGELTAAQRDELLEGLESTIDDVINGTCPPGGRPGFGFGFRFERFNDLAGRPDV